MPEIYAVVLAAGRSSRLGSNKLTLKIDGEPVIRMAVTPFLAGGIDKVFVVANPDSVALERALLPLRTVNSQPVDLIRNPDYADGMSTSVRASLPWIKGVEAVFFHLGDKPFVRRETVERMLHMYGTTERNIIVPVCDGLKGHPVLMRIGPYLEDLKALSGDMGLREFIEKRSEDVLFIEGDESALFDIDTDDDIEKLKRRGYKVEKG
jgi:molybdenum cofactor cytidylyltransferase